jgi:hypothetical protein
MSFSSASSKLGNLAQQTISGLQAEASSVLSMATNTIYSLGRQYSTDNILDGIPDVPTIPYAGGDAAPVNDVSRITIGQPPGEVTLQLDVTPPSAPSLTSPTVPALHDITLPSFVESTIPELTATLPDFTEASPYIPEVTTQDIVNDSLYYTIKDKLEDNILNGGTMLNPTVEADIWNRDRERREQALRDAVDSLTAKWSKMGWSLPDGLLQGGLIAISNEYMNKDLDHSRDIAIKQAEMEQVGMFKSLELGGAFENTVVSSMNEFAKRRLEAVKINSEIILNTFKEKVNLYNVNLEKFKTDVAAWKTRIEAQMIRVEVYKAQIAGLQAIGQYDESRVKIYTAQIAANEQQVNLYNTQVKAFVATFDAERAKIEMYKAQIEGYAARSEALVKNYVGQIEAFKGAVQAWAAQQDTNTKIYESYTRLEMAYYEATLKKFEVAARIFDSETTTRVQGLSAAASAASNLVAGIYGAIHASVSGSYSASESTTQDLTLNI